MSSESDGGRDTTTPMDIVSTGTVSSTRSAVSVTPRSMASLCDSVSTPILALVWDQGEAALENFSVEQLKILLNELMSLQKYTHGRATFLQKHLEEISLGKAGISLEHDAEFSKMKETLRNTDFTNIDDVFMAIDSTCRQSFDDSYKRKRDDKKKRDKERKRKKKKRSGEEKESVKPDALWKSLEDYMRFPMVSDLEHLTQKTSESMFSVPSLGRHFSKVWREHDELNYPNKKKRKSYQTVSRRFRPKSDLMAIPDLPLRKLVKGVDDRLKPAKSFQVHSLAQRVMAMVIPLEDSASTPTAAAAQGQFASPAPVRSCYSKAPVAFAPIESGECADAPDAANPGGKAKSAKPSSLCKLSFDDRVRLELKFMGLIPANKNKKIDYTKPENREDDEIAAHLRTLQAELRNVSLANRSRCQTLYQKAAAMIGVDKDIERLQTADRELEKVFMARKKKWDEGEVKAAIEKVDAALKFYKLRNQYSQTGTGYVPHPEDFAGTPRAKLPNP